MSDLTTSLIFPPFSLWGHLEEAGCAKDVHEVESLSLFCREGLAPPCFQVSGEVGLLMGADRVPLIDTEGGLPSDILVLGNSHPTMTLGVSFVVEVGVLSAEVYNLVASCYMGVDRA